MNIYIAGPMRNIKDFNFPAFHEAAEKLRAEGRKVFSPAERDLEVYGEEACKSDTGNIEEAIEHGFSLREAMCDDLTYICMVADAVALLPGWGNSEGAKVEAALAQYLGLQVILL